MSQIRHLAERAKAASYGLGLLPGAARRELLLAIADELERDSAAILRANADDLAAARAAGYPLHLQDRLALDARRLAAVIAAAREVADLPDCVGEEIEAWRRPNGLAIRKVRVPFGLVGMIYEARPNVTVDAAAIALKSGNSALLRGGKEAIATNTALVAAMRRAVMNCSQNPDIICLVEDTSRESAAEMMGLHGVIDLLIPRGGASLIRAVVDGSKVPVIETGVGNCHVYIHEKADPAMAVSIAVNAKTTRVSVCNSAESLMIDAAVAESLLPAVAEALWDKGVKLFGCPRTRAILGERVAPATEEDYAAEYLDLCMSVKVVADVDEAIAHVNRYGSQHSECIVTEDSAAAGAFMRAVDAAVIYHNASTRFTDGGEFGFGAEIGISTSKLHARGPMALREMTSYKYLVYGEGQIR